MPALYSRGVSENAVPPAIEPKGTAKSPLAGCSILIVATLVMVALIGWALWTLRFQEREIAKFTQVKAAPVPLFNVEENTAALNGFKAKLNQFQKAIDESERAELRLSARDINLAIAQYDLFSDFRETFFVREITDKLLHIDISYKLGNAPFSGRKNFLNGKMTAVVELVPREVILRIQALDLAKGEMPKEFFNELSTHRIMEVYKEHESLGPIMSKLTSVEIVDDLVVVMADPAVNPPSELPEDIGPMAQRTLTLVGIIATLFLTAVGLLIFTASKKKKAMNSSESS